MSSSEKYFEKRRRKITKEIGDGIALFPSSSIKIASRDYTYPYFQDPDFFYLTSHTEAESALVLTKDKSILFLRERNKEHERWEGELLGTKRARSRYSVDEVRNIANFQKEFPKLVKNHNALHYVNGICPEMDKFINSLFKTSHGPETPNKLLDARLITSKLRLVKDPHEVKMLSEACDITAKGFLDLLENLSQMTTEAHAAKYLEASFAKHGAIKTSFSTIVASGKNASILHHHASNKKISKNSLLLIDAGAHYQGYAGDICRTVPANGKFSTAQAELYDIVLETLEATIKQAKKGVKLATLHKTACKKLTKGMIELKILKGSLESNLKKETYKKYFMHGIGHLLGLDVHDITPSSSIKTTPLPTNSCITLEPGLYFDANDSSIPKQYRGIGIRVEEDVLITSKGCRVLTKRLPRERDKLEDLLG